MSGLFGGRSSASTAVVILISLSSGQTPRPHYTVDRRSHRHEGARTSNPRLLAPVKGRVPARPFTFWRASPRVWPAHRGACDSVGIAGFRRAFRFTASITASTRRGFDFNLPRRSSSLRQSPIFIKFNSAQRPVKSFVVVCKIFDRAEGFDIPADGYAEWDYGTSPGIFEITTSVAWFMKIPKGARQLNLRKIVKRSVSRSRAWLALYLCPRTRADAAASSDDTPGDPEPLVLKVLRKGPRMSRSSRPGSLSSPSLRPSLPPVREVRSELACYLARVAQDPSPRHLR
jgi:hypothetical protein